MEHQIKLFVEFGDTDGAQIVYYPHYYRWMDQATHALFRAYDYSARWLKEEHGIIMPLLESSCQFYQSLKHEDEVTILSSIDQVDRKVFHLVHHFMKDNQVLVAEGREVRGWVTMNGNNRMKAIEIPESIKQQMKGCMTLDTTN